VTGKGGVLGSSRGARALDAGEASVLAVPDMRSSWSEKKLYKVAWSPDHVLSRYKANGNECDLSVSSSRRVAFAWPA
jgi:hypothetical protein